MNSVSNQGVSAGWQEPSSSASSTTRLKVELSEFPRMKIFSLTTTVLHLTSPTLCSCLEGITRAVGSADFVVCRLGGVPVVTWSSTAELKAQRAGRRGWWEVWGARPGRAAAASERHFSPRFTRGNSSEHNVSPPSCSVLSVLRWVFPANQEPAKSTCDQHWPSPTCLSLCSAGCRGRAADSGPGVSDQDSW